MTNPYAEARALVVATMGTIGVTVFDGLAIALSGPAVVVVATDKDSRGRVTVEATASAPLAGNKGALDTVDQLAWDMEQAIHADLNLGWASTTGPLIDAEAQRVARTLTIFTRP